MTYLTTHLRAMTVGLVLAVVFQVTFTVCEFVVKYAFSAATRTVGVALREASSCNATPVCTGESA